VMRLEQLGEKATGDRLMQAIERVTADKRFHTPDLGGKARTADVTAAVVDAIHGANI
jgi:tartrate dehydrogenase/decarboxylase/D-malate dehydrogenase